MKTKRTGAKLQMTCHRCHDQCSPKDGDWHNGAENQVFLCRGCEPRLPVGRRETWSLRTAAQAEVYA